ncbi:MAG: hypothetical protein KAJ19_26480 [Gammaproteobacteria bacterium]|nr:hypothetical protein [Gammaproteobacteria bacterium]
MMEKPYRLGEYPKMHLSLPDFQYKPRSIAAGQFKVYGKGPTGGFAIIDYGDASCSWGTVNAPNCIGDSVVIELTASHFWHAEFNFVIEVAADDIPITSIGTFPSEEAWAWDTQKYAVSMDPYSSGSVTICGFASTHTLTSQTFETKVAGMPVGLSLIGGSLMAIERGQTDPATVLKNSYGIVGANCGCITLESNCGKPPVWDRNNSATTVVPNDTCVVTVEGGLAPYSWSVSGTGFSFAESQTSTGTNTLTSGADACGTAVITVSTASGDIVGYVRSTVGQWANQTNGCIIPGAWTSKAAEGFSKYWFYRVEDQYRQSQQVWSWYGIGTPGPPPEWSCADVDCVSKGDPNCVDCLEWSCTDFNPDWDNCGGWCCGTGFGCAESAGGYCMKNTYLYYEEWIC